MTIWPLSRPGVNLFWAISETLYPNRLISFPTNPFLFPTSPKHRVLEGIKIFKKEVNREQRHQKQRLAATRTGLARRLEYPTVTIRKTTALSQDYLTFMVSLTGTVVKGGNQRMNRQHNAQEGSLARPARIRAFTSRIRISAISN